MKFISAVIILVVVATGCLADECEQKALECLEKLQSLMLHSDNAKDDQKKFCQQFTSVDCLPKLKDACHKEAEALKELDKAMKMLSDLCNSAGFPRNNFWVLASALLILFSARKAF